MRRCPFCAEEVQDEAVKCKHCHASLRRGLSWIVAVGLLAAGCVLGGLIAVFFGPRGGLSTLKDDRPLHYARALELYDESKSSRAASVQKERFEEALREARLSLTAEYKDLDEAMRGKLRTITGEGSESNKLNASSTPGSH